MSFRVLLTALVLAAAPSLATAQTLGRDAAPVQAALRYVEAQGPALGLSRADTEAPLVTDAYLDEATGIGHVYLRQQVGGVEVADANLNVTTGRTGGVVYVTGAFFPNAAGRVNTAHPSLAAEDAVARAAAVTGERAPGALAVTRSLSVASRAMTFEDPSFSLDPVTARLVYHQTESGALRLAWETMFYPTHAEHLWVVRVDAQTGAELARFDLVAHDTWGEVIHDAREEVGPWLFAAPQEGPTAANAARSMVGSYLVYAMPLESPSHGGRTAAVNPDNATASPFGWHDTNGAAGAEFTITRGNNAHAYLDLNSTNASSGDEPDGGAGLTFAPPIDLTQEPANYRPAAVVNLFYWNNIIHDVLWHYGFTAAAGNFQQSNYGLGGTGNDYVMAESQDGWTTCVDPNGGNCRNNANFATPLEGSRPRMQMYIWNSVTPNRDSGLDAGVVVHEYGHGVSSRLTGGPATFCLGNAEQMGEGWSDFYGHMLTMRATDTRTTTRGAATYALGQPTTGPGSRPAPYSTNFAVNDYTYQDTRTQAVPHGVGFVWATILWEVTWDMIDAHGFSADFYNGAGTAGNQMMLRLVTEAMKLQPCSPGFVTGRDAILQADANLYPDAANPGRGLHYVTLWNAFARRGLGLSASQGLATSNADNTEAFDTPLPTSVASITPTSVVAVAPPNGTTTATVTFTNTAAAGSADLNFTAFIENATIPAAETEAGAPAERFTGLPAQVGAGPAAPWLDGFANVPALPPSAATLPTAPVPPGTDAPPSDASAAQVACLGGQVLAQDAATFSTVVTSGGQELGQSFTAPCTGYLATVSPFINFGVAGAPNVTWQATLRVHSGAGTGGPVLGGTSFQYTNGPSGGGLLNIPMATQPLLTQGQVYTWFLDLTSGTTGMQYSNANPYSDGVRYRTTDGNPANAVAQSANDMQARITFAAPVSWIAASTSGGSAPTGTSRSITLTFNATGLAVGTYTAELQVTTNASATPTLNIPITFVVRAAAVQVAGQAGWRMMAAPTSTMTVANLAAQNLVQGIPGYYATDPNCGGVCPPNLYTGYTGSAYTAPAGGSDVLQPGRGMLWYFYNQNITPGGPSNSVALPMTVNAPAGAAEPTASVAVSLHAAGNKWNLVGNPFMSGLNVSTLPSWASGGTITSAVGQVWDPNVGGSGSYILTSSMANVVAPWQGFLIENNTATTLTIPTSAKVNSGTFHREVPTRMVAFELEGATPEGTPVLDRAAALVFHPDATPEADLFDASKLTPLASAYATLAFEGSRDGAPVRRAQESRPFDAASFSVPMAVEAVGTTSTLTLRWPQLTNVPETWTLALQDLVTGTTVDLRSTDAYTFTVVPEAAAPLAGPSVPGAVATDPTRMTTRFVLTVTTGATTAGESGATPAALALGEPTPNPSAGAVALRYDVPAAADVRLEVFDVLGRRVATLVEGPSQAGRYTARWEPQGLSSGTYVVRLISGDVVLARRVTLTR